MFQNLKILKLYVCVQNYIDFERSQKALVFSDAPGSKKLGIGQARVLKKCRVLHGYLSFRVPRASLDNSDVFPRVAKVRYRADSGSEKYPGHHYSC